MLVFCDSFDHYSTLSQKWDTVLNSIAITTAAARTGLNGARVISNGQAKRNVATNASAFLGFAFNMSVAMTTGADICSFYDGSTEQVSIACDTTGHLIAIRGGNGLASSGTTLGTSTAAITFGSWHYIEVKVVISPTVGVVEVKVDGVVVLSLTGQNTRQTANSSFGQIAIGCSANSGGTFFYDDLYYEDTTGSFNTNYLGDTAIKCVVPSGNGTLNQWTIAGSSPAATHWQGVNEIPPDDGVTFESDGTLNDIDRFTFPAVTGASVFAAVVNMRANLNVAGTRSIRGAALSGGTAGVSPTDLPLNTTFADYQGILEVDPNTSAAWTIAAVNAAEFGAKVTV